MPPSTRYPPVASFKSPDDFTAHVKSLGIDLPFDREVAAGSASPLAQPFRVGDRVVGNRFCVLPMEGWDGTAEGAPSELVFRRWRRFGQSGAKLIWGGEAVAVRRDGRANPNQLLLDASTEADLGRLREELVRTHEERFGRSDDLLVGLQLTHSGRFARPREKNRLEPVILYRHPLLDAKFGVPPEHPVLTDDEVARLVEDFVRAAARAARLGFDFVDLKHCHGYLGHEFLSAVCRPGKYGGSFENRTRFLREAVAGIRAAAPALGVGVRVSVFDFVPFAGTPGEVGRPMPHEGPYPYAFGGDPRDPVRPVLDEPIRFLDLLQSLGIRLVCVSAGSPYYTPHIQRPALFPPSDGYAPPEDPLVGVARQIGVTAELKALFPGLAIVGSGYSYLQEFLPHVARHNVRTGRVDFVGLGRMMLAYPDLPHDVLRGAPLERRSVCRTFSECTTAPRNGMVSGCFPLDPFYRERPEAGRLREIKARKTR